MAFLHHCLQTLKTNQMKKLITVALIVCVLLGAEMLRAQNTFPSTGAVGIGTTSPNSSSLLDVTSTTKGILVTKFIEGVKISETKSVLKRNARKSRPLDLLVRAYILMVFQ